MANRMLCVNYGYIKNNAPLKNGLGRYIPQLLRMTIKFDKERGVSHGVREFIETDLVKFAQANPHVAIYLKPRRNRSPVIITEYLNGERNWASFHLKSREEIAEWLDLYRLSSGKEYQIQTKYEYSENTSIQGMWTPFTNVDPSVALASYPMDASKYYEVTATERLQRLFESKKGLNQAQDDKNLEQNVQGKDILSRFVP